MATSECAKRVNEKQSQKDGKNDDCQKWTVIGEVVQSHKDTRCCRCIKLDNDLRALIISEDCSIEAMLTERVADGKPDFTDMKEQYIQDSTSWAYLCVGVGSFSDPPEYPGTAHLLEHMLFLGSKKYPKEHELDDYIDLHGGFTNAHTESERTIYNMAISTPHFWEGLDRFAEMFANPLISKDSTAREVQAVDNEFQDKVLLDVLRKERVLANIAFEGHPIQKFAFGNSKSLKPKSKSKCHALDYILQKFYSDYYSSNIMTLVVLSQYDLETLTDNVATIFSRIPNKMIERPSFHNLPLAFGEADFCRFYRAVAISEGDELDITWVLPPQKCNYRVKPLQYLANIITDETEGSIISNLRERTWATGIYTSDLHRNYLNNSAMSLFTITIELTNVGVENIGEIIMVLFEYLKMLRCKGPDEELYEEMQYFNTNDYSWQHYNDDFDQMAVNMLHYPVEDYIAGDALMYEYNAEVIDECLDHLQPSRANILLYRSAFLDTDLCPHVDPYFGVKYGVKDIPPKWKKAWKELRPRQTLKLPRKNEFISKDFSIKKLDPDYSTRPGLLFENDHASLWFLQTLSDTPYGAVILQFLNPSQNSSPSYVAMVELYLNVLEHSLRSVSSSAAIAELYLYISRRNDGIFLEISGLSPKLPLLFKRVVDQMKSPNIDETSFLAMKDMLLKQYYNEATQPDVLAEDLLRQTLYQQYWTAAEKQQNLTSITIRNVHVFVQNFFCQIFIDVFVNGNFTKEEAKNMMCYLLEQTPPQSYLHATRPETRIVQLPVGERVIRVSNMSRDSQNAMIYNHYQFGLGTARDVCIGLMLEMLLRAPLYNILRTRQQLGYDVGVYFEEIQHILGMTFYIRSQSEKYPVSDLDKHIESFLKEFAGILKSTKNSEFRRIRERLALFKEYSGIDEETERFWKEIDRRTYEFDRLDLEIAELKTITLKEVRTWFNWQFNPKNVSKLSIQVVGQDEAMEVDEVEDIDDADMAEYSDTKKDNNAPYMLELTFLEPENDEEKTKFITNIQGFKKCQPLFPASC